MNSHEQPYGRWSTPPQSAPSFSPKPFVHEDTLKTVEIQIERKVFRLALKENMRGRLLRITEEMGQRRNTIIVPTSGLREFLQLLDNMILANEVPSEKAPES